jgi:hypothetical protein
MKKETITPKKAMEYLKRNVHNRPLSPSRVRKYATTMTSGQWKVNGDCVRFNGNGDLIDGQHRLTACVSAGIPFETYVIRGLDHDAFDTIDQGAKRTISDVFARQGYKHYTTLASGVRWLYWYLSESAAKDEGMRPDQANEILENHPELHRAAEVACKIRENRKFINPGTLTFLIYECGRKDAIASEAFWGSVMSGIDLKKGDAALLLRKRLEQNLGSVAKLDQTTIAAIGAKAWNSFRLNKPTGVLKWSANEAFPTIVH